MTALKEYEKLEATGLWRETVATQRREVIVSFGNTSLMIADSNDTALSHWSLPAVARLNPGEMPAVFSPNREETETLEIEDSAMVAAIEKVLKSISKRRPHPGRLRLLVVAVFVAVIAALGIFWLPDALVRHTVKVVPFAKRVQIGQDMLDHLRHFVGDFCETPLGSAALSRLEKRIFADGPGRLLILPHGVSNSMHLPGNIILLKKSIVEDYEVPEVAAGFAVLEQVRAEVTDPMSGLLYFAGIPTSFKLLTTGEIDPRILNSYAKYLLVQSGADVPDQRLLDQFAKVGFASSPFAYAVDVTGETTLTLIEADPFRAKAYASLLDDSDWVSLQGICGG